MGSSLSKVYFPFWELKNYELVLVPGVLVLRDTLNSVPSNNLITLLPSPRNRSRSSRAFSLDTFVMYYCDDWPKTQDGLDFDGKQLLALVRRGESPFHRVWDVNSLIREVEDNLGTKVTDIPFVHKGSNNYVCSVCNLII